MNKMLVVEDNMSLLITVKNVFQLHFDFSNYIITLTSSNFNFSESYKEEIPIDIDTFDLQSLMTTTKVPHISYKSAVFYLKDFDLVLCKNMKNSYDVNSRTHNTKKYLVVNLPSKSFVKIKYIFYKRFITLDHYRTSLPVYFKNNRGFISCINKQLYFNPNILTLTNKLELIESYSFDKEQFMFKIKDQVYIASDLNKKRKDFGNVHLGFMKDYMTTLDVWTYQMQIKDDKD